MSCTKSGRIWAAKCPNGWRRGQITRWFTFRIHSWCPEAVSASFTIGMRIGLCADWSPPVCDTLIIIAEHTKNKTNSSIYKHRLIVAGKHWPQCLNLLIVGWSVPKVPYFGKIPSIFTLLRNAPNCETHVPEFCRDGQTFWLCSQWVCGKCDNLLLFLGVEFTTISGPNRPFWRCEWMNKWISLSSVFYHFDKGWFTTIMPPLETWIWCANFFLCLSR